MNSDKTKINIKEETNSNIENNEITKIDEVNLSSKSFITKRKIIVTVLLFLVCLSYVFFMKSNLKDDTNITIINNEQSKYNESTSISSITNTASITAVNKVKPNMKERANKRNTIHNYFKELLKNNKELNFSNYLDEKNKDLLIPLINQINIMNENYPDEIVDVFEVLESKKKNLDLYIQKIAKDKEIEKAKKQGNGVTRFLQNSMCTFYNCNSNGEYSFNCCLYCSTCCVCDSLWVNDNDPDYYAQDINKWKDYYKLQTINDFLTDIISIQYDNTEDTSLVCPIYDHFYYECIPSAGYLCFDMSDYDPQTEDYFKCSFTMNMLWVINYCYDQYINSLISYSTYQSCVFENVGLCYIA